MSRRIPIACGIILFVLIMGCAPGYHSNSNSLGDAARESALERYRSADETADAIAAPTRYAETGNVAIVSDEYERIAINARQFEYDPSSVTVSYGDKVMLTVTSIDVGHGFALPAFGINDRIPPEESRTFIFIADKKGEFEFFNPVYSGSGWKDMIGTFKVG